MLFLINIKINIFTICILVLKIINNCIKRCMFYNAIFLKNNFYKCIRVP